METKDELVATNRAVSYEDFEPYCLWQTRKGRDSLKVFLQDFKKEQLKVQVKDGILVITGERPLINDGLRSRFKKAVKLSKHCKITDIHATFSNLEGVLTISLPNKTTDPSSSKYSSSNNTGNGSLPSAYLVGRECTSSVMAIINRKLAAQIVVVALAMAFGAFVYRSRWCCSC